MRCSNCGTMNHSINKFCSSCGFELSNSVTVPINREKFLNCPNCGSDNLHPITEYNTTTSGGGYGAGKGCLGYILLGPLGLLCGACGSSSKTTSTSKTFWICGNCGNKFRNRQDEIKEDLAEINQKVSFMKVSIPIGIIACIFLLCMSMWLPTVMYNDDIVPFLTVLSIVSLVLNISFIPFKNKLQRKQAELLQELNKYDK